LSETPPPLPPTTRATRREQFSPPVPPLANVIAMRQVRIILVSTFFLSLSLFSRVFGLFFHAACKRDCHASGENCSCFAFFVCFLAGFLSLTPLANVIAMRQVLTVVFVWLLS
jgi:hypothetical protein